MSEKIVTLNEEVIKGQLKELVRGSVEETLNELLEQEAEKLTQAARYERNEARQGYRSGHYDRNLTTTSGDVTLHVPGEHNIKNKQIIYAASCSIKSTYSICKRICIIFFLPEQSGKRGCHSFFIFRQQNPHVITISFRFPFPIPSGNLS